jgi:hypothetical protein
MEKGNTKGKGSHICSPANGKESRVWWYLVGLGSFRLSLLVYFTGHHHNDLVMPNTMPNDSDDILLAPPTWWVEGKNVMSWSVGSGNITMG